MIQRILRAAGCMCCMSALLLTGAAAVFNGAPTIQGSLYHTLENVTVYGNVKTFDPEGDAVELKITGQAEKGSVSVEGTSFVYTPFPGQKGEDRFTVRAMDYYGNRSEEASIAVVIDAAASLPRFADMDRHPYEYSAIRLADAGVVTGERVGDRLFFHPLEQETAGDFLVMLLAACGQDRALPVCVNTGLSTDAQIPLWLKPYVKRALELGILRPEEPFQPAEIPTRAQAVVYTHRAAGIQDILRYHLTLADADSIPAWAVESYMALSAYKMLDLYDGCARPHEALDRGFAASLVWQLYKYKQ